MVGTRDPGTLTFFSHYESPKGRDMDDNPAVEGVFLWTPLERQVRVNGTVAKVAVAESDAYWSSRPRTAQLAIAATTQSSAIEDYPSLGRRKAALAARLGDGEVPRPESYGGYRLTPRSIEFWQGRPEDRLHLRALSAAGGRQLVVRVHGAVVIYQDSNLMKAIVLTEFGSPDVLELRDVAKPVPKDDEVLVKVHATAINDWDWAFMRGKPLALRLIFGVLRPKIDIPGVDVAGAVEAVGKNVEKFQPVTEYSATYPSPASVVLPSTSVLAKTH